ncbi:MAG TPA: PhoU domain-containing protein [Candidatus Thermoplasmatota archaeon]|nr:PhoU domain-containing protein [Candidatus Thermoplasmatota archaeon]
MEFRKIQTTGGSSYAITLPKQWISSAGLQPGDVVACNVLPDGRLVIQAGSSSEKAARTCEVLAGRKKGEQVFRSVVAAYLMGFDVIRIRGSPTLSPEVRRAVEEAARRVIGLEVVDEDPGHIVLQDFLDPTEFHIARALRRMQGLTRAMHEEAAGATPSRDEALLQAVVAGDDEVDRLYWMINKQYHALLQDAGLGEKMGLTPAEGLNFLLVARLVERTADHAARIARQVLALGEARVPPRILEAVSDQHRLALALFQRAIAAFFAKDAEASHGLIDEAEAFQGAQERILSDLLTVKGERLVHLAYVLESVGRTAAYAADVAEVTLNYGAGTAPAKPSGNHL